MTEPSGPRYHCGVCWAIFKDPRIEHTQASPTTQMCPTCGSHWIHVVGPGCEETVKIKYVAPIELPNSINRNRFNSVDTKDRSRRS